MENQHQKITGYRDLSAEEIALMNRIKQVGEDVSELVLALRAVKDPELDQRWISIGQTHLQQGFMALVRSVAQPTTF